MKTMKKEPLIRIAKRNDISRPRKFFYTFLCLLVACVISILFLFIVLGKNPFTAVLYIFNGTFQNSIKAWSTIKEFAILLAISLALTPAYTMKFWNVGAQGQILMGGLLCSVTMIYLNFLPSYLVIIISLLAGIVGGGLWAFIPAFFKSKFGTNETLFTLMMNYIAALLVTFCNDIWKGNSPQMGQINSTTKVGWLTTTFEFLPDILNNKAFIPLLLSLLLAVTTFIYIKKTKHGYEIKVVGESKNTAKYSGIRVSLVTMRTLILSGAICGIVGFFYVSLYDHVISATTSGAYGFTAIIVCWLSGFNPFLMIIYSFLIIFLNRGASNLGNANFSDSLNEYSCELILFVIILAIMLSHFFVNYRLIYRDRKSKDRYLLLTSGIKEAK